MDKTEITPVSAIGFDPKLNMLILGDIFGNVELWNVEKIILKATYNKHYLKEKFVKKKDSSLEKVSNQESSVIKSYFRCTLCRVDFSLSQGGTLLTETYTQEGFCMFETSDIKTHSTRKRSHLDGITHIDVMPRYEAFATSSYDCCVYVWAIREHRMLGALLLGSQELNRRISSVEL